MVFVLFIEVSLCQGTMPDQYYTCASISLYIDLLKHDSGCSCKSCAHVAITVRCLITKEYF